MNAALAAVTGGYTGPPNLTLATGLTSWTVDLPALAVVAALAGAYVMGVRRVRAGGGRWPAGRTAWFFAGVLVLALTSMSFLGIDIRACSWHARRRKRNGIP